jgi:triacylglycerol lipase
VDGSPIWQHLVRAVPLALADVAFTTGWHARELRIRMRGREVHPILRPDSPVLLIPGVYEGPRFLDPLASVIRTTARPVHTLPELARNTGTILETATIARDHIRDFDLRDISIVSHSMGGLVGKLLMVWPETADRIRDMIAIAAPFAGSRYAPFTPRKELRQFAPREAIFAELAASEEVNGRIVSAFGRIDPQIPDVGVLPGARNVRLRTSGHFRVLADRGLHRLLIEVLSR